MVCTGLPGPNKWDHCRHLTWELGHRQKWDHYKHPLLYHCVLCWGGVFLLDQLCGYQYEPLKGKCIYGFYSSALAEQVRPLHASYLKTGSPAEVRPLQASLIISLGVLLGWSFLIRSSLRVSILAPKGSVCLWFVQFAWTEEVRPLHASYLQARSLGEWDHYKHPLPYPCLSCWGDVFSLDYVFVCQ